MTATAHTSRSGWTKRPGGTAWAALLSAVGVMALWLLTPSWSASLSPLLAGMAGSDDPLNMVGRALGAGAGVGRLRLIWAVIASLNAGLCVWLVSLAGGQRLSWASAALVLLLAPDVFRVIGLEGPLLLATLLALLAGHLAAGRPAWAAAALAISLAGAALLSPLGLLATPGLALLAALWPRPATSSPRSEAGKSRVWGAGVRSGPVALAWLAGVLGGLALVRIALPGPTAAAWWTANLSALRAPMPRLLLGGWSDAPGVGGLIAVAAFVPVVPLVVAGFAAWHHPKRYHPEGYRSGGGLAAAVMWWLVLGLAQDASERFIAHPGLLLMPLLLVAALPWVNSWLHQVSAAQGRVLAGVLGVALLLSSYGDRPTAANPRSVLARSLPVIEDPTARLPAVLRPAALTLLAATGEPSCILPDRAGGHGLMAGLRHLKVTQVRDWDAFTAPTVLVQQPAIGPIAEGWRALLRIRRCAGDVCLLDRAGTQDATPQGPSGRKPR